MKLNAVRYSEHTIDYIIEYYANHPKKLADEFCTDTPFTDFNLVAAKYPKIRKFLNQLVEKHNNDDHNATQFLLMILKDACDFYIGLSNNEFEKIEKKIGKDASIHDYVNAIMEYGHVTFSPDPDKINILAKLGDPHYIEGINYSCAEMADDDIVKKIKGCQNADMEADEFMFLANYNFDNEIYYKVFKEHDYPVYASIDMFDEDGVDIPDNTHKAYETINTIEGGIEKFCKEYPDLVELNDDNHDTTLRKITIDTLKRAENMEGNCIEDIIQMVIEDYE